MYASKFKIEEPKLMKRLWGDQFYHPKEKKWSTKGSQAGYVRGFSQYVLEPIYQVFQHVMKDTKENALKLIERIGVKMTSEDKELEEKQLLKVSTWEVFEYLNQYNFLSLNY